MKLYKIKLILGIIISLFLLNTLRVLGYKYLFGYKIQHSSIGFRTIIVVDAFQCAGVTIGRNNKFIGPISIKIGKKSSIGKSNTFNCGWWTEDERFISPNYERSLVIEKKVLITSDHYFDIVGQIYIGENSWIAGRNSQFWTHGIGVVDHDIIIEKNCYVGSAVRFTPGVTIKQNSLVGMGSVVTKHFTEENILIAGQPAKIIKKNYDWNSANG